MILEHNGLTVIKEQNKTDKEKEAKEISLKLQSEISKAISNLNKVL